MVQLEVLDAGRAPYAPTLELQRRLVDQLRQVRDERAFLVLIEHDPPVITLGRGGNAKHVLAPRDALAARGFEVHETSRGGDVTYHGPGQLVGYPILRLDRHGKDVHRYLRDVEEVLIRVLGRFGLEGERVEGLTGVWVGGAKIAAAGIAISRWVSYHGFALNVSTDLTHFQTIVPCGISDKPVTSLSVLLGRTVSVEEVKPLVVEAVVDVFGFDGAVASTSLDGSGTAHQLPST